MFVDESKGTGKGYDIAYIAVNKSGVALIDVSRAAKVPLAKDKRAYLLSTSKPGEITVDMCAGAPGDQIVVRAALDVVTVRDAHQPCDVEVAMRGAWYGSVKSDRGDILVRGDGRHEQWSLRRKTQARVDRLRRWLRRHNQVHSGQ